MYVSKTHERFDAQVDRCRKSRSIDGRKAIRDHMNSGKVFWKKEHSFLRLLIFVAGQVAVILLT